MKEKIISNFGYLLSFGIALCLFFYTMFQYNNLPDQIPTHFSFSGHIDAYGDKQEIFNFLVVTLVLPFFFYCIQTTPQYLHLSLFPPEKKEKVMYVLHHVLMWFAFAFECITAMIIYYSIKAVNIPANTMYYIGIIFLFILCIVYGYLRYIRHHN